MSGGARNGGARNGGATSGAGRWEWQRSSYSGGGGESCVELARDGRGLLLRESDAPPTAMLRTTAVRLAALLAAIRGGRLDRPRPAGPSPR
ncbi:DUF397 domain-containing protein [Streptomyces sp. B6B3]|uniref:DUF397 domain-containing protein n=1 Tax=Streptomyces sp. B6B3 TaxID=3153570 RepID=UPI00325E5DD8